MKPIRIRLSRAKGFNLQEISKKFNGLDAVKVDRTNRYWGNPYVVGRDGTIDECLEKYAIYLPYVELEYTEKFREEIEKLRNKNLACWCKPNAPCHADYLLKFVEQYFKDLETKTAVTY